MRALISFVVISSVILVFYVVISEVRSKNKDKSLGRRIIERFTFGK